MPGSPSLINFPNIHSMGALKFSNFPTDRGPPSIMASHQHSSVFPCSSQLIQTVERATEREEASSQGRRRVPSRVFLTSQRQHLELPKRLQRPSIFQPSVAPNGSEGNPKAKPAFIRETTPQALLDYKQQRTVREQLPNVRHLRVFLPSSSALPPRIPCVSAAFQASHPSIMASHPPRNETKPSASHLPVSLPCSTLPTHSNRPSSVPASPSSEGVYKRNPRERSKGIIRWRRGEVTERSERRQPRQIHPVGPRREKASSGEPSGGSSLPI